jgi:hypothetical protein
MSTSGLCEMRSSHSNAKVQRADQESDEIEEASGNS